MALSNMYAQQAAKAADYRKMAEVQGDSKLASIYQGEYDRAIAQSLDCKFQEDKRLAEDSRRAYLGEEVMYERKARQLYRDELQNDPEFIAYCVWRNEERQKEEQSHAETLGMTAEEFYKWEDDMEHKRSIHNAKMSKIWMAVGGAIAVAINAGVIALFC